MNEEPEEYWNFTNPDKYLLKAIENPGKQVTLGIDDGNWPPDSGPFKYNGKYYHWSGMYIEYWPEEWGTLKDIPIRTAMALAVVWGTVGLVYIVSNRENKSEP